MCCCENFKVGSANAKDTKHIVVVLLKYNVPWFYGLLNKAVRVQSLECVSNS